MSMAKPLYVIITSMANIRFLLTYVHGQTIIRDYYFDG